MESSWRAGGRRRRRTRCRHDAGTAFVVFDDHRRANWTPYVFRTDDYGETWTSITKQ